MFQINKNANAFNKRQVTFLFGETILLDVAAGWLLPTPGFLSEGLHGNGVILPEW